jgi:hypothetical protein
MGNRSATNHNSRTPAIVPKAICIFWEVSNPKGRSNHTAMAMPQPVRFQLIL